MAKNIEKSSIADMNANVMALVAYLGGGVLAFIPGVRYFAWIVPVIILLIEKKSSLVKKSAAQSIVIQLIATIVSFILYVIVYNIVLNSITANPWSILTGAATGLSTVTTIAMVFSIAIGLVVIVASIKAYNNEYFKIPFVSTMADKIEKLAAKIMK